MSLTRQKEKPPRLDFRLEDEAMEPSVAYELGRAGLGGLYEGLHHHPGMSMHGASPAAAGLGVAQATSSKGEGASTRMCPCVGGCEGGTPRCAIGALTQ